MDKQTELLQWVEIAESDFATAQHVAKTMWPVPYQIVCFHCQQAAEKYDMDRALLFAESIKEFVRNHFPEQFAENED